MKKRVLSILLSIMMLCSLLPTTALADEPVGNTAEKVTFQVNKSNGASGTVSYRFGSEGEFTEVTPDGNGAASVNVPDGATNITVKAVPTGEYKVNQQQSGIWVNGNNTLTTDESKTAFFTALVGENGYTYALTSDTPQFVIEFDNNDGTGGGNQSVNANNIRFNVSGNGDVTYQLGNDTEFLTVTNGEVNFGENTSIVIKATPTDGEINAFDVLKDGQSIYDSDDDRNTAKSALTGESGLTISDLDKTKGYEVNISFSGGSQQPSDNIEVQFDTGSENISGNEVTFTVNETSVTVTVNNANISDGKVSVPRNNLGSVTFTLGNTYDGETMQVIVRGADNYSSVLEVSNSTVSLDSLNIPDGGLHFNVEAIGGGENPDPGGEDPSQPQSGAEISFGPQEGASLTVNGDTITFINSESATIGTVKVYIGESDVAYTGYQTSNSEVRLNIPVETETVVIVLKPEGDLEAQLVYGGDIRDAGAISGPDFDDDTGTYTYTITVENIPENDSGSKFVGITIEFGTNHGGGEDFTAVIWNGDQVEQQSANGTISVASIDIGTETYTYNSTTGKFDGDNDELLEWYHDNSGESGVRIKDAAFGESQNVEVYINFVFKPDYGYQVTGVGTNENPTSLMQGVSAAEAVSTFKFPVSCNNNPHFTVVFSPSEDVTDVSGAQNVRAATIADGQNATDSGNLKLTVADLSGDELNDAQSAFANQMQATDDADNIMYLDVDLFQVVSKGTAGSNWETQLTDLEGEISVTLNVGAQAGDTYYIIRQHTSGGVTTYTREQATNNGDGTITFTTDKFSTYAIGYTPGNDGGDTPTTPNIPSVPSTPTTPNTPTDDKVDVPISGDDETIHVGATVSGDTVTVDEIDMGHLDGILGSDVDTGTVTIDFSGIDSAVPITTVELPADIVKEIAEAVNDPENDAESLEIIMPNGVSIMFDADALSEKVSQADGADITISIESREDADLTDAQKDAVGSRPAFDINVTSGGKHISDMGGKITVHAPYELKPNEKENGLIVWYVDNEGNRERCQGSYDPINKRMNWETDHLSLYMIDYCPSATFEDLDIDAWYTDSTDFVIANDLMNGIGADKFDPNGTTSRAMIVTILWRLEGSPVVNDLMDFGDVATDQWYTEAVRWAAGEKIVEGYGNGKFGTNDPITREQMMTIMWRYAKYKGYDVSDGEDTNILSYGDAFDVAEWAIPAMQWACGEGLIIGIADGNTMNLQPQGNTTRAQAAAILQRYCENVVNKD